MRCSSHAQYWVIAVPIYGNFRVQGMYRLHDQGNIGNFFAEQLFVSTQYLDRHLTRLT